MSKTKFVHNPLLTDYVGFWDKAGDNPQKIIILAGEIEELPEYLADHAIKEISQAVLDQVGSQGSNPQAKLAEIKQEITREI